MTVNTLGSHHDTRPSRTVAEWLWPFVPMGIAAFSLSALIYYHLWQNVFTVSSPLQQLYAWLYRVFGFAPSVMFFGLTILWSTIWLASGRVERPAVRFVRLSAMAVMLGIFLNLGDGGVSPSPQKGVLGAWFAETLVFALGYWTSLLLVWAVTFASLLLATDFFFHESFERMRVPAAPAGDAGVEAAVTDHLRGLGSLTATPARGPVATSAPAVASAVAPAPPAAAPVTDVALDPESPVETAPRRRSYEERRAARAWRRAEEDEWLPPVSPESQEIDDPEAGVAREVAPDAEAVAGSVVPPPVDADVDVVVAGDDEVAAVADAQRETNPDADAGRDLVGLSSGAAEVLIWPDEMPTQAQAPAAGVDAAETEAIAEALLPRDVPEPAAAAPTDATDEIVREEPVVPIPRPEPVPEARHELPAHDRTGDAMDHASGGGRQQELFGAGVDEALVQEAIDLVTGSRRANVSFLQRKLRIDYETAAEVLAALAARGVVALEGDATQGRVLG